ncbi:plasmid mobilization relaxosome protein MobC [Clostridium saudiense]
MGVNINQIAKRTNETNRIYEDDIKELKGELEQVWQLLKSNLSSQH